MYTGLSNIFLDKSPRATITKGKMNRWNYIKLKSFCTTEEAINKKATYWRTYLQLWYAMRLISEICKEFIQLSIKETIRWKMDSGHEYRYFSKEDIDGWPTHGKMHWSLGKCRSKPLERWPHTSQNDLSINQPCRCASVVERQSTNQVMVQSFVKGTWWSCRLNPQ